MTLINCARPSGWRSHCAIRHHSRLKHRFLKVCHAKFGKGQLASFVTLRILPLPVSNSHFWRKHCIHVCRGICAPTRRVVRMVKRHQRKDSTSQASSCHCSKTEGTAINIHCHP